MSALSILLLSAHHASAVEPTSTLLLYNTNDSDSIAIRDHYVATHPGVRSYGLDLTGFGEEISAQEYLDEIRTPVFGELTSQAWGAGIDTLVTTKGLPLRIDAGYSPQPYWQRYSSLESELTRIDSISSTDDMGSQNWTYGGFDIPGILPANPYYLGPENDIMGNLLPYEGPEGFDRSNSINENIRLTARLDGYSRQDVIGMINRAQRAYIVPFDQTVVVDDHPAAPASPGTAMTDLATSILPSHNQTTDYDVTNSPILAPSGLVLGYVSHGVHGGLTAGVPGELDQTGYIAEDLGFEYANGAIFHTYESFNAFSFDLASTNSKTQQGQVAQWIAAGGTAGLGHVEEPTAGKWTVTNEDIFFDMMSSGYTLAEAAWAATRQLSFVNTVVGDPLMKWQDWLPGDANLDGLVDTADASLLFANWGNTEGLPVADGNLNGDFLIDSADIGILYSNWTTGSALAPAVFVVPEPASLLLLALGIGSSLIARRRKRA